MYRTPPYPTEKDTSFQIIDQFQLQEQLLLLPHAQGS
jgi:hypothetical protein